MRAAQWTERATRDLPNGVAARVTREAQAHLQDAGLPESADVRAVLGDPAEANTGLRRLYLTRKELEDLTTGGPLSSRLNFWEWLAALVYPVILLVIAAETEDLTPALASGVLWTVVALTWNFHPIRRRQWRLWLMLLAGFWLSSLPAIWELVGGPAEYAPLFATLVVLLLLYRFNRRDARLRRTLKAEEDRA
ncbi:hypothetical protein SAMN04488058_102119 [Deinococcus reticulitermitis]|uniref:Uncharacterized protein n=1 Tax=Deinococcus reticulitermitis TaxID=856736 RepID=A0A1H6U6D2_9DEIO|nr:hypothetical protein [Deinococcus reticulitermitis]SEI87928.1 hypothetical protein SAMN04488058_102119 [Deinococcus reticulitermitis]